MLTQFDDIIEVVLHHEGGYVNDPKDPGGETNFGVAKRSHPDVDIANKISSGLERVLRFLVNNSLGLKSLIAAVNVEESCSKEMAGIPSLLTSEVSLTKNSAVKCCASAADPPLPQSNTLPPSKIDSTIELPISIRTLYNSCFKISSFTFIDSSIAIFIFKETSSCMIIPLNKNITR